MSVKVCQQSLERLFDQGGCPRLEEEREFTYTGRNDPISVPQGLSGRDEREPGGHQGGDTEGFFDYYSLEKIK